MQLPDVTNHLGITDRMAEIKADKYLREFQKAMDDVMVKSRASYQGSQHRKRYKKIANVFEKSFSAVEFDAPKGKKNARAFGMLFPSDNRLVLYCFIISPKDELPVPYPVITITRHALIRLIQRGNTDIFNALPITVLKAYYAFMAAATAEECTLKINVPDIGRFIVLGGTKTEAIIKTFLG